MKLARILAAGAAVLASTTCLAADIEVLSAVGFQVVMDPALSQFEKATGHHARVRYGPLGEMVKRVNAGESADVIVLPTQGLQQLAEGGKLDKAEIAPIASSQLGMAVRKGSAKPDISTTAAFRKVMLDAKAVTMVNPAAGGASYPLIVHAFERMQIHDEMKPKMVFMRKPGREGITLEASEGQVDIALNQMQELLDVPGLDLVGPLPAELQQGTTFAAAPMKAAANADAARELVAFLRSPERAALIRAKGLQPQ